MTHICGGTKMSIAQQKLWLRTASVRGKLVQSTLVSLEYRYYIATVLWISWWSTGQIFNEKEPFAYKGSILKQTELPFARIMTFTSHLRNRRVRHSCGWAFKNLVATEALILSSARVGCIHNITALLCTHAISKLQGPGDFSTNLLRCA